MHVRNQAVQSALAAAGIDADIRIFSEHLPTAALAAEMLGIETGAIANSLVFWAQPNDATSAGSSDATDDTGCTGDSGYPLLIMTSGAHRVDTKLVARTVGLKKLGRATPDQVLTATGQRIGGVSPCGHPESLDIVIDTALAAFPILWAAGGTPDSMFPLTYQQLVTLTRGREIAVE